MGFRENCPAELADALHVYVRAAFDSKARMPERPSSVAYGGELTLWPRLATPDSPDSVEALWEAGASLDLLTDEARLYVTPRLMLCPFPHSEDYGISCERLLFRDDLRDWLRIYSPLQLNCLAFYALMPASLGDFGRAELWRKGWWNLPLALASSTEFLDLERVLVE